MSQTLTRDQLLASSVRVIPYNCAPTKKRICTFDTETDPFARGVKVRPFTCGFYDGSAYFDFWGTDCIAQFFLFLKEHYADQELLIYCHNWGGFDAHFCVDFLDIDAVFDVRDGRLVRGFWGGQEFRDSLKILPFALDKYKKTKIDYAKFTVERRQHHKREIRAYQKDDCVNLYELVYAFQQQYGDKKTIASAAFSKLRSMHGIAELTEKVDFKLREYYYGGRVQPFVTGIVRRPFKMYDVNSMYMNVMAKYQHPVGSTWYKTGEINANTWFVRWTGSSRGGACFTDHGLKFIHGPGTFLSTIHEYRAGIQTGTITPEVIHECWNCDEHTCFDTFVNGCSSRKIAAKHSGDKIGELFSKTEGNSGYGKLGQNPRRFVDTMFTYGAMPEGHTCDEYCIRPCAKKWKLGYIRELPGTREVFYASWSRPALRPRKKYYNVGTAASITGAARAELLLGIAAATDPLYCDTDSIFCASLDAELDNFKLGAWKYEGDGRLFVCAGKKLYAVFCLEPPADPDHFYYRNPAKETVTDPVLGTVYCHKKASKGSRLSGSEIYAAATGETVEWENEVPTFRLNGNVDFIKRKIRSTYDVVT